MANARLHRLRFLESRVADTLATAHPSFTGLQESPHGTYSLTSTEHEAMLKQARVKMRRARLVQVRAQEMLRASQRLQQLRDQRRNAKTSLLMEVKMQWKAGQRRRLKELEEECAAAIHGVGHAHRAAARLQGLKEVREVTDALRSEERRCCAVLRYAEALQKEYGKREELESKKGIALERRKQVEYTAEMDRNLARVSAYGAKIKSKLRQIKQTFQPECKPDYEVTKLRDYKYTFMHNHWAALRDKTNAKGDDANAWEAADWRTYHDQIRLRHGEVAIIAKQRVAQRGQAAHVHLTKNQEIRRLENELKVAKKQETEQKIAAMLSGEPYHGADPSSGAQASGLQKAIGSPSVVACEEHSKDTHPHVELYTANSPDSKVAPLLSQELPSLQNHVKAGQDFSSCTVTLHVPGDSVSVDQRPGESTAKIRTHEMSEKPGLQSSPKVGRCEFSQVYLTKPLVMKSIRPSAESPGSAKNADMVTSPKRRAGIRHNALSRKPRSKNLVAPKEITHAQDREQSRANGTGKDGAPSKGGRKRQAEVLSFTEANSRRESKFVCRRCLGSGEGSDDTKFCEREKCLHPRVRSAGRGCRSLRRLATPRAHRGGALACAVSLLDEICGTAEVLENQGAKIKGVPHGRLPVSMKNRIRSTQGQLEALEQELYGQRGDFQGCRRMSKESREAFVRARQREHVDRGLPGAAQNSCLEERRRKGLEKHMRRMDKRSTIDQVGKNLWNIQQTREHHVRKTLSGMCESESSKGHLSEVVGLRKVQGKASRAKGTGHKLQGFISSKKQQVTEKSFFSMQLENFEFLTELQQPLQKLKDTSNRDGRISASHDSVSTSHKTKKWDRLTGGLENTTLLSSKARRCNRKLQCGHIRPKAFDRSCSDSQEVAVPVESGGDIGPWNRSTMSKTKRRRGGPCVSGYVRRLKDCSAEQTSAHGKPSRQVNDQLNGKKQRAITTDGEQNLDSQDSGTAKGCPNGRSRKHEPPWPDQLFGQGACYRRQVTTEGSAGRYLAPDEPRERDSATKIEYMSTSNLITDIEAAVAAALVWEGQDPLTAKHSGDACGNDCDLQSVAAQVASTDLGPCWAQADETPMSGLGSSSVPEAGGGYERLWSSIQTGSSGEKSPLHLPTPDSSQLPGIPGFSWEKIWEEVCESIESELECLGSGADSVKIVEELQKWSCNCLSSVDMLKCGQHQAHDFERLQAPTTSKQPVMDSAMTGPTEVFRLNADAATETDQPSLDSILGFLSQQVRELDERLRTATCSAVASSWIISESSRRSRHTTSGEGLPPTDDTSTADGTQLIMMDRLPVSDGGASWLSLPLTGGQTLLRRTDNSFSEHDTSNSPCISIIPGIRTRRTTVYLEGKGDSDGISSETGSPVSPLGLCFDALHDMQSNRDGVDQHYVEGASHSRSVPQGEFNLPLGWAGTNVQQSGKSWAQHGRDAPTATRLLRLAGEDVELVGSSVVVLPCRPRTTTANRGFAGNRSGWPTLADYSELPREAGDSGQRMTQASLFLATDDTNADSFRCKAGEIVLPSLSSLDLDVGEPILTASMDFTSWSPKKIRDIFYPPVTPGNSMDGLMRGNEVPQPAMKPLVLPKRAGSKVRAPERHEAPRTPHISGKMKKISMAEGGSLTTARPRRALCIFGSPGKWSIKPRLVTRVARARQDIVYNLIPRSGSKYKAKT